MVAWGRGVATLPDLDYDYGALEPFLSGQIMELHHSKHHQTYVNNLNQLMEKQADAAAKGDTEALIQLQPGIKFNGGGHVNHTIFWTNLCAAKDFEPPVGELAAKIDADFGSLGALQAKMNGDSAAVQGSGWGWLGYSKEKDALVVATTANQDPLSATGVVPLLGIDVWEHAYYLQYKNVRPDYLKNVWSVVNWKNVAERYAAAK